MTKKKVNKLAIVPKVARVCPETGINKNAMLAAEQTRKFLESSNHQGHATFKKDK